MVTRNHNGRFTPLTYRLDFARSRRSAVRDLAPPWGQSLQLTWRHTPLAGDYAGTLLSGRLGLRFPGLAAHHGLHLTGAYEWQDPGSADGLPYRFASEQPFVRGYGYRFHRSLVLGTVSYALPLLYPDWNVGALLFFQRARLGLFYDYGRGARPARAYQSTGAELTADFYPFSLQIPLNMGVRYVYRPDEGDSRFEMVVGI